MLQAMPRYWQPLSSESLSCAQSIGEGLIYMGTGFYCWKQLWSLALWLVNFCSWLLLCLTLSLFLTKISDSSCGILWYWITDLLFELGLASSKLSCICALFLLLLQQFLCCLPLPVSCHFFRQVFLTVLQVLLQIYQHLCKPCPPTKQLHSTQILPVYCVFSAFNGSRTWCLNDV